MILKTDSVIEEMAHIAWFANVGAYRERRFNWEVVYVDSWKEAIDMRGSARTADAFLEAAGIMTRVLGCDFRSDYRSWNEVAASVRNAIQSEVFPSLDNAIENISEIQVLDKGEEIVKRSARWDLIHFAMEHAYSELVHADFFKSIFEIYRAGYFPCCWNEVWPHGRIWVW